MAAEDIEDTDSPTSPTFFSTWGVPITLGALTGFMVMAGSSSRLTDQLGASMGTVATCSIGFIVAMAVIAGCRAIAKIAFGK